MKLSHEELISKLASSLVVDAKDAEAALDAWIENILKETGENKATHVPGLGTFRKKGPDMEFVPDEKLAIEVNHKYAGMNQIEVSPSFLRKIQEKDKGGEAEEEDDPFGIPEEDESPEQALLSDDPEATYPTSSDTGQDITGFITDDKEESPKELPEEPEKGKEKEPAEEHEEELPEEFQEQPETEPDEDPVEEPDKEPEQDPVREQEEEIGKELEQELEKESGGDAKEKKSYAIWFIPAAAVIIAAILLYFHFDGLQLDRQFRDEQEQRREQEEVAALQDEPSEHQVGPLPDEEEEADEPEEMVPEPEPDPAEEEPEPVSEEPDPAEADTDDQLPFGLTGPEEEVLIGAYTIVVHSLHNEKKAQIEHDRLAERDFKATLWQATLADGNKRWRVGIGQFETVSEAEEAISELPEPYRSNNFIIRMR